MKQYPRLSRKDFLSLGVVGGLGWLTIGCSSDAKPPAGNGTGGAGGGGTGGAGTGGAGTGGSGSGGAGGSAGSGGASGSGGSAGSGGSGGSARMDAARPDTGLGSSQEAGVACAMITANVFGNHATGPHSLVIPSADIVAGARMVYNARGMANHDHFIEVTAADFVMLKAGQTVTKFSCNGGDHQFVLSCGTAPTGMAPACGAATNMCGLLDTMLCV